MSWNRLGRSRSCPAGIARYTEDGDTLYVWCAGTEGAHEWLDNLRTRTVPTDNGARVNARDLRQALAVLAELERRTYYSQDRPVVLAGTSRGFAVACALAYLMNDTAGALPHLFGWAGKRAGNRKFYAHLADICKMTDHTAYHYDVVPFLPPWYAQTRIDYSLGKSRLPWRAHEQSFRDAARWRNTAGHGQRS